MDLGDFIPKQVSPGRTRCDPDLVVATEAGPKAILLFGSGVIFSALVALNLWIGLGFDMRPRLLLASDLTLAVCFGIAGIAAWVLRPRSRTGPMMLILGTVLLVANPYGFELPASTPGYTEIQVIGEPFYWLQFALGAHLFMSYPSGRLSSGSPERRLVTACYLFCVVGSAVVLIGHAVAGDRSRLYGTVRGTVVCIWIGFAIATLVVLVRRVLLAQPRQRRRDGFALGAAGLAIMLFVTVLGVTLLTEGGAGRVDAVANQGLAWLGVLAVPVAFFIGLLRERLAFAAVGDLVQRLHHAEATGVEAALAQTLQDPLLRVAFPTSDGLLDVAGVRYNLPEDGSQTMTPLGHDHSVILVHDPSLADEPRLLDAAGSAAQLALENARLYAEVRSQLEQVRASRQRIATAADQERQRLERDLHDGAQQHLLGIGFTLGALRNRLANPADREIVDELERELRSAIGELRDLAHGIRPAVLTDQGLGPALASLTRQAQIRVQLRVEPPTRLPGIVEATVYYVVSEALQNATKHTADANATVTVSRRDDRLIVQITDDGPGGAKIVSGGGLRGLFDRVSAVGGQFELHSPPGSGTTVHVELPCE